MNLTSPLREQPTAEQLRKFAAKPMPTTYGRWRDAEVVVMLNWRPAKPYVEGGRLWIDEEGANYRPNYAPVIRIADGYRRHAGDPPLGDYPHFSTSLDAVEFAMPPLWRIHEITRDHKGWHVTLIRLFGERSVVDSDRYVMGGGYTESMARLNAAMMAHARERMPA